MSKYIKLEDALKEFNYGADYTVNTIIDILYDLPTIDIVHCKDCKHWDDDSSKCTKWTTDTYEQAQTNADDFCSYGERKSIDDLIEQVDNLIAFERELIGDCNICRFAGCSECDDCINGSQWVRMTREDEE